MRAGLRVEWKQESGWKETNSGKKVQFGERQGERLLNEIGERGGLSEVGWFLCQKPFIWWFLCKGFGFAALMHFQGPAIQVSSSSGSQFFLDILVVSSSPPQLIVKKL